MARWEYLEVIRMPGGQIIVDSAGRYWESKEVKIKDPEAIWESGSPALVDLGAEGWELTGIIPGGVRVSFTGANAHAEADLLIFKR